MPSSQLQDGRAVAAPVGAGSPGATSLPNPLRGPGFAQTLHYGLDPEGFFTRAHNRFGDVFTTRVLSEDWVVLGHPAAVKEAFALGPNDANSGEANFVLRPLIGTRNLLLTDGQEHLARRKLVLPPFHGDRMRAYEETIREAAEAQIKALPLGEPVTLLPHMQSLTFSVIMRCVFGLRDGERLRSLGDPLQRMLGWITDMRRVLIIGLLGPDWLMRMPKFRRQLEVVDRELTGEIESRRLAEDLDEREDILSMLLMAQDEDGRGLSDQELRDELVTLLIAGHETTAALIAWAVHELARAPQHQDSLSRNEGGFSEATVTETLRLRPPVPLVLRRLRRPATIAGHRLPAGATLVPSTLLVHRRPDLYPEPWTFDPTRFLDRRPVASEWFPFGGSVRRCIGAAFAQFEGRIVLEELSHALHFEPVRKRPERVGRRGPVLVPNRGARVVAARR